MTSMSEKTNIPIMGGLMAAILSTVCCIVPLLLLTLGIGGVWMSNLTALDEYKTIFIVISLLLLALAYWQIFLKPQCCTEDGICVAPINKRRYKIIFWIAGIIILSSTTISYWAPLLY